jgi:predicted metalloprotease with PDZ domain
MHLARSMMRWCVGCVAVLFALLALTATAQAATPIVDYEVRRATPDAYEITLRFQGDASGRSTVRIPTDWAGAEHPERGIDDVTVLTPGARLEATDRPEVLRIVHRPRMRVVLRYRLRQIPDGELHVRWGTTYLPIIRPDHFEWIGWTTWVVPFDDETRVKVRVRFVDLPPDWTFASSFGLDRRGVTFEGRLLHFRESLFVGGDFRLLSRDVQGGRVVTAVRGAWPFTDDALADRVQKIVDGARAFWRDDTQPDFLITLMPIAGPQYAMSRGGTGLTRSFAAWTTPVESLGELDRLFTHEYFHTWNPSGLGTPAEPEALEYWFTEGFTDYYTHLLRLRWRMMTLDHYAAAFDDVLKALAHLKENTLPNAEIGARFFSEGETIGKLPYWRGMLLAARWDAAIRASSKDRRSLDDAMRALRDEQQIGIERLDAARIVRAMRQEGVFEAGDDVERFIDRGALPVLDDTTLTSCIRIDTIADRGFDAGFNFEASLRTKRITDVDVDGPAYGAGLRDGQRLVSISLGRRTDIPATVGVEESDGSDRRVIEYIPLGMAITRQRVAIRDGLDDGQRAACLAELGLPH